MTTDVTEVSAAPTRPKMTAAQQRKHVQRVHCGVRFGVQIAFFVLAPALFSGAFNGVKYLFAQLGGIQPIEPTAFLALLIATLAFTIVFGRFFCGYACAFGTLGDVLYAAFEFVRVKTGLPRPKLPNLAVRILSLAKYGVLAAICTACFFGVWASYSGASPWVAFAGILSGSVEGISWVALALLAAVVVGMIVRERFFCQFLCPLGAVFTLMPVLGFSEFVRTPAHCAQSCGKCHETCPVDIWPDANALVHGECISCGRCADACPLGNVNVLAIKRRDMIVPPDGSPQNGQADTPLDRAVLVQGEESHAGQQVEVLVEGQQIETPEVDDAPMVEAQSGAQPPAEVRPKPVRKTKEAWLLWRGTSVGYTLAKAALLLVICWVLGAVRYLPAFGDVVGLLLPPV